MSWDPELDFTKKVQDGLDASIPYLLAGLQGNTDGNELVSVAIQQAGLHGYRVVLRGVQRETADDSIRVVKFSSGASSAGALLVAEAAYRDGVGHWQVDRFAPSTSRNGSSKVKQLKIHR